MSEIVERVAKAIGDVARGRHGGTLMAWAVSPERTDCLAFAQAAIAAMWEPTKAMCDATVDIEIDTTLYSVPVAGVADDVWRAMIDAALPPNPNTHPTGCCTTAPGSSPQPA